MVQYLTYTGANLQSKTWSGACYAFHMWKLTDELDRYHMTVYLGSRCQYGTEYKTGPLFDPPWYIEIQAKKAIHPTESHPLPTREINPVYM